MKRSKLGVGILTIVAALVVTGSAIPAQASDEIASLEFHAYAAGSQALLFSAGPWPWNGDPWMAWLVNGAPTDTEIDILLLARNAAGDPIACGSIENLIIPDSFGPDSGLLFLMSEPEGIQVLVAPSYYSAGIVELAPCAAPELIVDIRPGSDVNPLNLQAAGVLPVAVAGTDGIDVRDIDLASISLAGVSPRRAGYEDVTSADRSGADGIEDLALHFDNAALAALLVEAANGDLVELTLTATFKDGTPVAGTDVVTVLKPGRGKR